MVSKELCTGCGACKSVCRQNAISMKNDGFGFSYPEIDKTLCISCGLCDKICSVQKEKTKKSSIFFGGYIKDEDVRKKSSSGGIFFIIAKKILADRGSVFGAAFSEDFKKVKHIEITDEKDLYKLQGSKYVQSDCDGIYNTVKARLEEGKTVLFSGTPCQISALSVYIPEKLKENLFLLDVICHGVPSPKVWEEYAKNREAEQKSEITDVSFRTKKENEDGYFVNIKFKNGNVFTEKASDNLYFRQFVSNYSLRTSCHNCKNKGFYDSDITLGDFWGSEEYFNGESKKGVSLIIVNSEKGKKLFESLFDEIIVKGISENAATKHNPSYFKATPKNKIRKYFYNDFTKKDVDKVLKNYCSTSTASKIRRFVINKFR